MIRVCEGDSGVSGTSYWTLKIISERSRGMKGTRGIKNEKEMRSTNILFVVARSIFFLYKKIKKLIKNRF